MLPTIHLIPLLIPLLSTESLTLPNSTLAPNSTVAPTTTEPAVEQSPELKAGLIILVSLLAFILLVMIITLILPKSMQDSLFRIILRQSPDQTFNYIDVGLYKTRHSIYRKEVYSLAMQGNQASKQRREELLSLTSESNNEDKTPASNRLSTIPVLAKSICNPTRQKRSDQEPMPVQHPKPSPHLTITPAQDGRPGDSNYMSGQSSTSSTNEPRRSTLKSTIRVPLRRRHSIDQLLWDDMRGVQFEGLGSLTRTSSEHKLPDLKGMDLLISRVETRKTSSHKQVCFNESNQRR